MSVKIGDRATFMGESGLLMGEASFLNERRWHFRYRNGKARTGWSTMIAEESALSNLTTPSWDVGDTVRVGFTPNRRKGSVTAIAQEAGRAIYTVTYPEDRNRFETAEGTRWIQDAHDVVVGAEYLDTNN